MTLRDLIATGPGGTDAEVLAWLLTTVTAPDPTRVTTTTVMARLSPTDAGTVFGTLAAASSNPLVAEAQIQLRGEGLDLSHANARAMIDQLFAGNTELRDKVKALGERQAARCEAAGYRPGDLSLQIVANARAQ